MRRNLVLVVFQQRLRLRVLQRELLELVLDEVYFMTTDLLWHCRMRLFNDVFKLGLELFGPWMLLKRLLLLVFAG